MSLKWARKFHWTLSSMILATAITAALIASSAGLFALYEMDLIKKNSTELTEEWLPKVSKTGEISSNVAQFRKAEWEFTNTKNDKALKKIEDEMDQSSGNVTIYTKSLTNLINDEESQQSFNKFSDLWDKYSEQHDKFLVLAKAKKTDEAESILNESNNLYTEMLVEIKKLSDISYEGSLSAKESSDKITIKARWLVGGIAGTSLLISFLIAWIITRYISKKIENVTEKLSQGSDILNISVDSISNSSAKLSGSVTEQVSALHETVASLSEVNNKVEQNTETAKHTLSASAQSMNAADQGMNDMNEVANSMNNISKGMEDLLSKVENSHKEMEEIVQIIASISDKTKVINDIVFQTRLLSFNASVEAARAGEQGKGFAVVAEEVGKLAQMSGQSASEIRALLDSSITKVHEIVTQAKRQTSAVVENNKLQIINGNSTAQKCSHSLQEIRTNIALVNEMINEISQASIEQGYSLKEISEAMNQLNDSTAYNSNIAQVTSQEAKKLEQQSKEQTISIDDLNRLIKR